MMIHDQEEAQEQVAKVARRHHGESLYLLDVNDHMAREAIATAW
jgi:hypothetical protein